jgi:hypothetical protein
MTMLGESRLARYKTMPYTGAMRVVATHAYDRRARKLFTPDERAAAELEIALAPTAWPVIADTGGARKARAARGGRGKSGGARVIYYVFVRRDVVYLLDVYAKSAKEDLSDAEKREIRKLIATIEAQA